MIRGLEPDALVEVLMNTLEGERYVRAALVEELLDILENTAAASYGRELLLVLSDDAAFARSLKRLRSHLEAAPLSSTRPVRPRDSDHFGSAA